MSQDKPPAGVVPVKPDEHESPPDQAPQQQEKSESQPKPVPQPKPKASGSARRRRRRALARLAGGGKPVPSELDELLRVIKSYDPKADRQLIVRAYEKARAAHEGQTRLSGEPYVTHPLAVAMILADLGLSAPVVAAAILHDTVEDTDIRIDEIRTEFGDEIALMVDGVTKLDRVELGDATTAQTVRKMVIAMAQDVSVLLIKLADRLHNMRTLQYMSSEKREQKAQETLDIYAPLAHRLAMNTIKWELEDLAFAALHPKMYEEIDCLVKQRAPSRDQYLQQIIEAVSQDLRSAKIKATVTGRPKHYYSIYQKMVVRSRDFADIYDLIGVRVLVDTVRDCYAALGLVHARWSPVPGRFKDYIAMPKFTTYQSLHTTVIGEEGKPVELQIRTHAMDQAAQYGVAAHWRYKQAEVGGLHGPTDKGWLRQMVEWQRETEDPGEFLDALRFDLESGEIYVFTPKGEVISLPVGSTPIDFAYAVHTEVGNRCVGAFVNHKLASLESELEHGDSVEILLSKAENAGPSRDWLGLVKSQRAKNKIRNWFARERRDEAIEKGKDLLAREMRRQGLPLQRLLGSVDLLPMVQDLHFPDVSALYAAIGESRLSAQSVVSRIVEGLGGEEATADDIVEEIRPKSDRLRPGANPGVMVKGAGDVWVKLARCCTPVPGDDIVGFVTRGSGVSIHRSDCQNVLPLRANHDRFVEVEWAPTASSIFLVNIQVEALDRARLLSDVTRALSDEHVNILSASVTTTRDRIAISRFSFELADAKHLGALLRAVRHVEGVFDVYRV